MSIDLKELQMPLAEQRLSNGLHVIVQEDRSSPIVAVHVMYRAGSRDEKTGRTGLAHLLEHLLFEGSQNCPKGEYDRLLEGVGGTNNGSTWFDRTNYYEVVPSHAVELALWFERERMGFFLPVLDGEMLDIQRSVVINERKQVYENRPYGLAVETLQAALYPGDHPYSWPTIGYMDDLRQITLDDARSFYSQYYAPANAVLVLAGDVSPAEGFDIADQYFGDIGTPGKPAPRVSVNGMADFSPRAITLTDRVSFPRVYLGWSVPSYGERDWTVLDVLTYLLSDGETSRLQRALIRDHEIAQQADAFIYPTALAGFFGVVATARSGVGSEELLSTIESVFDQVATDGVSEEEVAGAVRRARRDHLDSLADLGDRADEIAYAATVLDDPHRLFGIMNSYGSVTAADIQSAARQYLSVANRATVTVLPEREMSDVA